MLVDFGFNQSILFDLFDKLMRQTFTGQTQVRATNTMIGHHATVCMRCRKALFPDPKRLLQMKETLHRTHKILQNAAAKVFPQLELPRWTFCATEVTLVLCCETLSSSRERLIHDLLSCAQRLIWTVCLVTVDRTRVLWSLSTPQSTKGECNKWWFPLLLVLQLKF